jgi:hypothetical protein
MSAPRAVSVDGRRPTEAGSDTALALMRRIDELHLQYPVHGGSGEVGRDPTVVWGTTCQGPEWIPVVDPSHALILMGDWCGSGRADTADEDNRSATESQVWCRRQTPCSPVLLH